MTEDFIATHKIITETEEVLVRKEYSKCFDQNGTGHKWNAQTLVQLPSPILVRAPEPVEALVVEQEGGTEAKPRITVQIHANAVFAALQASAYPEWENAHGGGQSGRGDSASLLHGRGPNGEKIVRVCQVSPGRVTEFFNLLIPEIMEFEALE